MSAHDQMRKMLDELMGSNRDGSKHVDTVDFSEFRVCRAFLLGCCPHDVLAATRINIGECDKLHDPALRADFERARKDKDYFYDLDALDQLERFFEDCDRKTEQSKRRLEETQEELSAEAAEKANKVLEINEDIGKTLAEAERLGSEGKVEESMKLMDKVEELKKAKYDADNEYRNSMPASSYQQQKLRVCEVCSAFLGIHDNDRRLADHFGGKLHMGFVFLRERLHELRATASERRAQYEAARVAKRYDREDNERRSRNRRSKSRSHSHERSSRRKRSRSRSRDRRRRSRSRTPSKSRRSLRSRSRDKDKQRSRGRSPTPESRKSKDRRK